MNVEMLAVNLKMAYLMKNSLTKNYTSLKFCVIFHVSYKCFKFFDTSNNLFFFLSIGTGMAYAFVDYDDRRDAEVS